MIFNFNKPWGQLREACVGSVYPTTFFDSVADKNIRDKLKKILIETIEDLDNLEQTLINLGVTVHRPQVPESLSISDFVDTNQQITLEVAKSNSLIPRPPLQVRDSFFVCDNILYRTRTDGPYIETMLDKLLGYQVDISEQDFDAPLVTIIEDRAFIDTLEIPDLADRIGDILPKQIVEVKTGGHNDAVFSVIKPKVLLTLEDPELYKETFPGWDICHCPDASWKSSLKDFRQLKIKNGGRWWSPDAVDNTDFISFVDTWLNDWVGFAAETVFDVNCLVINENLVLINNHNKQVEDFLSKRNVDTIVVPFRHRFFWDGGIHCITNDLVRD